MKSFVAAAIAVAAIGMGSDYLLGGPVFETGGIVWDNSVAATHAGANVRLPGSD